MLLIILIILLWSLRFAHSFQLGLNAAMAPLLFSNTWISRFPAAQVCNKVTPPWPSRFCVGPLPYCRTTVHYYPLSLPQFVVFKWWHAGRFCHQSSTSSGPYRVGGPLEGVSPLIRASAYFLSLQTSISWLIPFPWRSLSLLGASLFWVPPLAPPPSFHHLSQTLSPS